MVERAVLYDAHEALGAKFTEFSGFEMPLYYSGIVEEHLAVRRAVGLFDVSHMSKVFVEGERAQETISRVTTSDPSKLSYGRVKYTMILDEGGKIIDDLTYMVMKDRYLLVPNAGKAKRIESWINEKSPGKAIDRSKEYLIFALQGPLAEKTLLKLYNKELPKRFRFIETELEGYETIVSRTGYTGEDGFEFITKNKELFMKLLESGKEFGIKPCGLGARDSLRLEKCMCLAGNELEGRTPIEANLEWVIDWDHEFIGKNSLNRDVKELLVPLLLEDKGVPRHGYPIKNNKNDKNIGVVTSGGFSPVLEKGIALGYVEKEEAIAGNEVYIDARGKELKAEIIKGTFV
ncbi:MAG: glycine cleavage system aminomethyltransferase GcvT [Candidatus Thermoplasmatota archaeon]|nr:glycine cleavage system aminomethyltransferase GcvT [Candidatus Thermoplasmatota archaeon]